MKRLNYNFLFGAIALTGAFAFTSCSSSEDETSAEVNPTYDGRTVKTQFAINIGDMGGSDSQTKTRMTSTVVQENKNFRGMEKLKLFCFGNVTSESSSTLSSSSKITAIPTLSNSIGSKDIELNSKEYKLFYDISIPTGTDNFLFYGFATNGTTAENHNAYMEYGAIETSYPEVEGTPASIKFSLKTVEEPTYTKETNKMSTYSVTEKQTYLEGIMEAIANTSYTKTTDGTSETVYWDDLDPDKTLGKFFYEFLGADITKATDTNNNTYTVTINSYSPLAGSSVGVLGTINTLYGKLYSIVKSKDSDKVKSTSITRSEMAEAICDKIKDLTAYSVNTNFPQKKIFSVTTDSDGNPTVAWAKSTDDNNAGFEADPNYPENLPNGAVQYTWKDNGTSTTNSDNKKVYSASYGVTTIGSNSNYINVEKIVYPASLAYSCNSPAMANDQVYGTGDFPETAANWQSGTKDNAATFWTGWNSYVKSTTQTVALRNNVNYGVAKLNTTVKLGKDIITDKKNAQVSTPTTSAGEESKTLGFKVTGILIGGQKKIADWEFLPYSESGTTNDEVTIYEKFGSGNELYALKGSCTDAKGENATNYCLVFDNFLKDQNASNQAKVKIAVEFENNSTSTFEGHDGIVVPGQKFYLIGELNPTSGTGTVNWETNSDYRQPGATSSNENGKISRVFIQDHTTTENLTVNSFENAYVNIPDLRSTQLMFGLSVNLTWLDGLTFNTTIGEEPSSSSDSTGS